MPKIIGIVIVTHEELGEYLIKAANLIIGERKNLVAEALMKGESVFKGENSLLKRVQRSIKAVDDGDGVLILTDLFGASPTTVSLALSKQERVGVVSGVNLPMLLEVLLNRGSKSLEELAKMAVVCGAKGIINVVEKTSGK